MLSALFRIGSVVVLVVLAIPIGTIYRQNIEMWAAERGLDSFMTKGVAVLNSSPWGPWLLVAFVFVLGGAVTLWTEFFFRKRFPRKFSKQWQLVQGKKFLHQEVVADGIDFLGCEFVGVTFVYKGTGGYRIRKCHISNFSVRIESVAAACALGLVKLAQDSGRPFQIDDL